MFDLVSYHQNIAFYDEYHHYVTYGELAEFSRDLYETIGSRNLIYFVCDNTLAALVYYVAFLCTDNVVQLIPNDSRGAWMKKYVDAFQPDYFCVSTEVVQPDMEIHRYLDYHLLKYTKSVKSNIHPDLSLLLASSGSTGECKFIRQSKMNIQINSKSIIHYLDLSYKDRPILSLPMSYTYGLSIIHTHLSVGATILLTTKKIFQKEFWDFFMEQEGTSFGGVPFQYETLYRFGFLKWEIPSLNCMTQAGGKLSDELIQKYNQYAYEKKIRFFVMYGQTEATARMTYLPFQCAWKNQKVGSVGIAVPGTQLYLETAAGEKIWQANQEGEIIFQGGNVSMGYAKSCRDLNRGDDNKGVLKTGDIAYRDEEGYLYLTGRKKRFIKIYGKRISLDSMEEYMARKYKNEIECAIVGDDTRIAVVINDKECNKVKYDLVQYYQIPSSAIEVKYLSDIPKTLSGKKDYYHIKKWISQLDDGSVEE